MTDEPQPPDINVDLPMPDSLKVTTDRPYRILLISDLAGTDKGTLAGPLESGLVEINADNFDEVMSQAGPMVNFTTTDPLKAGNAMAEVQLTFASLKGFQPAAILAQLPATKALMAAREQIVGRLLGKTTPEQLTTEIAKAAGADATLEWLPEALKWTPAAPAVSEDVVDDVLSHLDLGDGQDNEDVAPPKSAIGEIVSAAASGGAGPKIPASEASALRRALAEIDRQASSWLNTILHAPAIQQLEARWRSLGFIVARTDFRKGLRLIVMHAPREQLTERLTSLVIDPVFDEGADAPDVIVVDSEFGNTAPDIEILDEIAQHAASLPAVAITGASAEFFGVKHAWQVATLPAFVNMFDQWQFAKWKTLRGQFYARSLGLVFGRGLLRAPYGGDKRDDLATMSYREECVAEKDFLWATGAVATACTIARSVAESGWPTNMVGRVDGFAVGHGGKKGDKQFGPADTQMPFEKAQELAMAGLNAVITEPHQENIIVCNGFSAAAATRSEGFGHLEVSLPYQLFASRLSTLLLDLKPHLAGKTGDALVGFVLGHARDWLSVEGVAPEEQQISVQAKPLENEPGSLQLAVTITPPPMILPGGVPVVVGYRLS